MPKRSNGTPPALPVIYNYVQPHDPHYPETIPTPLPLPVGKVTYLHFHNLLELAYCVSGSGFCHAQGQAWSFAAGDVQIFFPYQPHLSQSVGDSDSYWYWLNIDPIGLLAAAGFTDLDVKERILQQEMGLYGIIDRAKYPEICSLVKRLVLDQLAPDIRRTYTLDRQAAGFYALLTALREASLPLAKLPPKNNDDLRDVSPALLAIRRAVHSGENPAIGPLAALCSMSQATFRRRFAAAVGMSAKEYTDVCRMRHACSLLHSTDAKVIDVAAQCGFENISGFNRCFLKHVGVTPSAYKKSALKERKPSMQTVIRHARPTDLPALRRIYNAAKTYMDATGNPDQWKPGSPADEILLADMAAGNLYAVCTVDGDPHAVFAMIPGIDPAYNYIEGAWLQDAPYAALHRVASDGTLRGVVAAAVQHTCASCPGLDIRIDTHEKNAPMQRALAALGFAKCGTIYLANGDSRWAYQKIQG